MNDRDSFIFAGSFLIFLAILTIFMTSYIDRSTALINEFRKGLELSNKEVSRLTRELQIMKDKYEE